MFASYGEHHKMTYYNDIRVGLSLSEEIGDILMRVKFVRFSNQLLLNLHRVS